MSDFNTDHDDQDIPSLRNAAKAGKAALSENAELKRALLFAKAGIDTDSRLGSMLFKTWEGDDLDALKVEAQELGMYQSSQRGATAEDASQQDFRQSFATGNAPGAYEEATPDPMDTALRQFQTDLKAGVPRNAAQLAAIDRVLVAGVNKDARVLYTPTKLS